MDDLPDWLRLTLRPGVGPAAQRALLAAFGLPGQIFRASHSAVRAVVGAEITDQILAPPQADGIDAALRWCAEPGNHILTLADPDYPPALLDIPDPPVLIYVKGDPAVLGQPALAVVGARSATPQGIANAAAFARSLADSGLAIVSGLALGIDTAAYQGALASASGKTVAVIGTGADRVYPARNKALAHQVVTRGAIISEFPLGTAPLRHNFPRRNRIIAGLARGVLVVEAAVGSGSLITARLATDCGREVFAIPGSIHSPLSRGCHRLIREGAKLVETAEDVLEELRWGTTALPVGNAEDAPARATSKRADRECEGRGSDAMRRPPPTQEGVRLLELIGYDPVDIDTLAARSGLTLDALYAILLPLELDGHISRMPGGRFQRL
jgi:DNA processing protein